MPENECTERSVLTRINLTYYDPTYITNSLQNTIDHYNIISYIDKYKNYNTQLVEDITVVDINLLYVSAQYPIKLSIIATDSVDLLTSEFYLYQQTSPFSFVISDSKLGDELICAPYIHCFYATVKLPEDVQYGLTYGLYNPNIGNTEP